MNLPMPQQPAAAASAPTLVVQRLHYEALATPFVADDESPAQAAQRFAGAIGAQAAGLLAEAQLAAADCDDYLLAATLNSTEISDPEAGREAFSAAIGAACGRAPDALVNAYECVSWAPLLRAVQRKATLLARPRRLLMQVVDADVHGMRAAWETRTYGAARFGITSVLVEVAPGAGIEITSAPVERSMMKFAASLRAWALRLPQAQLAVPFFPEPARSALHRAIPGLPALPDRHDRFGHCFGSDPWIALALAVEEGRLSGGSQAVIGSLALNGYIGCAGLALAPAVAVRVRGVA